jgi:hypothetical protein
MRVNRRPGEVAERFATPGLPGGGGQIVVLRTEESSDLISLALAPIALCGRSVSDVAKVTLDVGCGGPCLKVFRARSCLQNRDQDTGSGFA